MLHAVRNILLIHGRFLLCFLLPSYPTVSLNYVFGKGRVVSNNENFQRNRIKYKCFGNKKHHARFELNCMHKMHYIHL